MNRSTSVAACHYHADRPGVGVCMRCRVVICAECRTRVDGVNHCHACLKVLGRRTAKPSAGQAPSAVVAMCILGAASLLFFGMFWLMQGWLAP